jgi:integrase
MGLMLKTQRDGTLRRQWYGVYTEGGARTVVNLNVKWLGTPPASGRVGDLGNPAFEASRNEAEKALKIHVENASRKGRVEHLTERLIESKTGRTVQYACLVDLHTLWRNLGREGTAGERYLKACDAHFARFTTFMLTQKPAPVYLYEVTPEAAAAFVATCRKKLAPATAKYAARLMNKAFSRFLPVGTSNPFSEFVGRRTNGDHGVIHRKPFTAQELQALLDAARNDSFMYPLIVTAACSGMRRGDVCGLKWADVDLADGMLVVKTSKTGGNVEIPIFNPLRDVLESRKTKATGYVFPEAVAMLRDNPNGLSWRFKKIAVRAFEGETAPLTPPVSAAEIETEGKAAIARRIPEGERRDRMLETLHRYAAGASVRQIEKATSVPRSTVSADLHGVEAMTGKTFMRGNIKRPDIKAAMARLTRVPREHGQLAASTRDFHALRATFVTLALSAGVPVELVRRVTGHATVEIVLKHYFRPDRENFKAALTDAMPDVLTGRTTRKQLTPIDEMGALLEKVKAGNASEQDKNQLRLLAAQV